MSSLIPSPYFGKNINYVIYYKMISAFLVLVAIPLTSLLILNFLVSTMLIKLKVSPALVRNILHNIKVCVSHNLFLTRNIRSGIVYSSLKLWRYDLADNSAKL